MSDTKDLMDLISPSLGTALGTRDLSTHGGLHFWTRGSSAGYVYRRFP